MSSGREVSGNVAINDQAMDPFELLYVYLVFPIYWVVMVFVLLIVNIRRIPAWDLPDQS